MQKRQIELFGTQHAFVACQERFTAYIGGIGSGKSFAGAVKALHQSAVTKGLGLVLSPTYPMLRDASLRTFLEVAGETLPLENFHKTEMLAKINGGGEVLFRSADKPDRLRGPNVSWAWIDEGALCAPGTWEIVIGRLREGGKAGPCWVTTTPKGRNWLYERQDQMTIFRSRTQDNPYLDREFVRSLEASYTGQFAAQELAGEFVGFDGLVYEEFDRSRHVVEAAGPWARVIAGLDEGYTNPAVILVIGLDHDDRAHVLEEFYQRRVLQGDLVAAAQALQKRHGIEMFYADPSAAGLIADLHAANVPVRAAQHAVKDGIQTVKARLALQGDGRYRLTVAPACVNTIAEFESYIWKAGKAGLLRDEPEKVNDHAMDSLRYALFQPSAKQAGVWGRR